MDLEVLIWFCCYICVGRISNTFSNPLSFK